MLEYNCRNYASRFFPEFLLYCLNWTYLLIWELHRQSSPFAQDQINNFWDHSEWKTIGLTVWREGHVEEERCLMSWDVKVLWKIRQTVEESLRIILGQQKKALSCQFACFQHFIWFLNFRNTFEISPRDCLKIIWVKVGGSRGAVFVEWTHAMHAAFAVFLYKK